MGRLGALVLLLLAGTAACAGGAGGTGSTGSVPFARPLATGTSGSGSGSNSSSNSPIKHIIIVVQENRSFDNLFATFPGADGTTTGVNYNGATVPLVERPLMSPLDLNNSHLGFETDYDNGKMDGWYLVDVNGKRCTCAYQYVKPADIRPYWTMAKQYVLADHLFQTQSSGSFTAHQDLIRGNTALNSYESLIDFPTSEPWGCDDLPGTVTTLITNTEQYLQNQGPFPCLTYSTIRDLLDAKNVSWKYYSPLVTAHGGDVWDAFDSIKAVRYSSEWGTNVSFPETNVLRDIHHHRLPSVAWVVPDGQNSDHPDQEAWHIHLDTGPSWVAQIVNAVGTSKYWKSTAIVITWDDWGGWYDHVPPPQIRYDGLGFRVPMIVVSPYAKAGYISHTQYEFGSILKFVENTFALGRLGTTDVTATSIGDVFDFSQKPRPFETIPAKYSEEFFLHQKPSNEPVDDE
jgi:phospholipase C